MICVERKGNGIVFFDELNQNLINFRNLDMISRLGNFRKPLNVFKI